MSILALVKRKRAEREESELSEESHVRSEKIVQPSTSAWLSSLISLSSQPHDRQGISAGCLLRLATIAEKSLTARQPSKSRPKVAVLRGDAAQSDVSTLVTAGWRVLRVVEGSRSCDRGDDAAVS